jgi:L,D-transpeptidase ErfK/SrfK
MSIAYRVRRLALIGVTFLVPAAVHAAPRLAGATKGEALRIKVDLSERRMTVSEGGKVVKTFGVAVGRASNPTPTGSFRTGRIEWNPSWTPPPRDWAKDMEPRDPGDPRNPMQGVKIYFREPWYFIHGTNDPRSIGSAASRGCLRMRTADAKALARMIQNSGGSASLTIVG